MRAGWLLLGLLAAALPLPAASADACAGGAPPAWFLGVVFSPEMEDWAVEDVGHFERYIATLRASYCIPAANAAVLAFWGDATHPAGSEANLKAFIAAFGAASAGVEDAHFFFALSSHGNVDVHDCPTGATRAGSFSFLLEGAGEDGFLLDCELGAALDAAFDPATRMWLAIDCSFCGGFSDSLTAASGTLPDNALPQRAGVAAPGRIVVTGCAMTTECTGSLTGVGSTTYHHLARVLDRPVARCDGWTAPGFPLAQGIDAPAPIGPRDGRCSASEWFYAAVEDAYTSLDALGIQQQFRMKYGFDALADDIVIR